MEEEEKQSVLLTRFSITLVNMKVFIQICSQGMINSNRALNRKFHSPES